jgi:hypothetical protein
MNYSFTPQQLADLMDDAFDMGKRYATDELNTLPGFFAKTSHTPQFISGASWNSFLNRNGGHGLSSIDAKRDLLARHLVRVICNSTDVQFED